MGPLDLLTPEPAPLFGGPSPRNAYVELHNLIAAAEGPADFGPADRDRISRRHGVDLTASYPAERRALYQALLDDALADGDLGGADRARLAHVADTLALSAGDLRAVHRRTFGATVEAAVADDRLSVEERLLLYTLQHAIGLDPALADGAYGVLARKRLLTAVAAALADGEVSSEEAETIDRIRRGLSVEVPERVRVLLDEAAARWQSKHGPLPQVPAAGGLDEGEVGHLHLAGARWCPLDGSRLAAASAAHRAGLDTGRTAGLRVPEHALTGTMDVGDVVLTDRRLLFRPARGGQSEVPHYALADVFAFSNGVVVRTTGGRSTFLDLGDRADAFVALARRLRRPARPLPPSGRGGAATPPGRSPR